MEEFMNKSKIILLLSLLLITPSLSQASNQHYIEESSFDNYSLSNNLDLDDKVLNNITIEDAHNISHHIESLIKKYNHLSEKELDRIIIKYLNDYYNKYNKISLFSVRLPLEKSRLNESEKKTLQI